MRFSMILEMVDRLSGPARRARGGVRGLADNVRQMGQRIRRAVSDVRSGERSLEHFARRARRLRQVALGRIFQAIGATVRGLTRNLGSLIARLRLVERAGRAAGAGLRKLGGMGLDFLKNGLFGAGAAVVGAGAFAAFDLIRTAGQFEQYKIQLEGIEGSAKAAKSAMAWVTEFAKVTPYELDEVMEAFTRLKGAGLDPLDGSLKALGDGASGTNKQLLDAVEMMTDAMQGEFERLKEFNVTARKEGNRTVFSYIKNGKAIERVAKGTRGLPIRDAITSIFNDRFGGGMERQSKTMFGIISNLKGMWTEFLLKIADAGLFDYIKSKLQGLLDLVNEMAANGELDKWAKSISDNLVEAFKWVEKFVKETDWEAVGRGLATGVEALVKMIELLGKAAEVASDIANNDGVLVRKSKRELPEKKSDPWSGIFQFKDAPKPAPKPPAARKLSSNFTGGAGGSITVGGKAVVEIVTPAGVSARTASIAPASPSVPMEVRTGRTMRGAA